MASDKDTDEAAALADSAELLRRAQQLRAEQEAAAGTPDLLEQAQRTRARDRPIQIPNYPASVPTPPSNLDPYNPKVDKYFGSKLPPVCSKLGCFVTDNGKFYYCINPNCHKDKKRETKYNRRKRSFIYFFCPKCRSREIQLHLRKNQYECMNCAYGWSK